jgi:hypothetical protein
MQYTNFISLQSVAFLIFIMMEDKKKFYPSGLDYGLSPKMISYIIGSYKAHRKQTSHNKR